MCIKSKFLMTVCLLAALIAISATQAHAVAVNVGNFGDEGWFSDDTRNNSGVDLVGVNYTHAGKSGQTPTTADDIQIANQIQFIGDAPNDTNALKLSWTAGTGSGKATLSVIDTNTGFSGDDWNDGFFANMRLYRETATNTTIKIGVQSTLWGFDEGQSQYNFTASRSGESAWDLVLVYAGDGSVGAWKDIVIDSESGTWSLFDQAGNSFYAPPGNGSSKTLDGWADDATWGNRLFGTGAKVTSVAIGAGSFSVPSTGYVDYLETSLLNGGDRINFVPEPGSLVLLITACLGAVAYIWRRRRG